MTLWPHHGNDSIVSKMFKLKCSAVKQWKLQNCPFPVCVVKISLFPLFQIINPAWFGWPLAFWFRLGRCEEMRFFSGSHELNFTDLFNRFDMTKTNIPPKNSTSECTEWQTELTECFFLNTSVEFCLGWTTASKCIYVFWVPKTLQKTRRIANFCVPQFLFLIAALLSEKHLTAYFSSSM